MRLIITICFAFYSMGIAAQTDRDNKVPKDPKAKEILDQLSAKNKSYKSITADFEFRLHNTAEGLDDTQTGTIIVKGDKYKLALSEQEIISNGKLVWTYLKDAKEVQVSEVSEEDEQGFMNPKKMFTLYESGFKYVLGDDQTKNGIAVNEIRLYPENPGDKPFHTVLLYVDKAKIQIQSVEVKSKDGNNFIYTLKNFSGDKQYAENYFDFKTPAGVEVIDLR
ncbi:MAG: outer membrane lipoprotein carrier protein LolA [Flavobacteriales bacterium]|nr:outer membrane lipoprotein carrier protein LolA [Flavobacteriales bacterium]